MELSHSGAVWSGKEEPELSVSDRGASMQAVGYNPMQVLEG